jgi:hypothetical protein
LKGYSPQTRQKFCFNNSKPKTPENYERVMKQRKGKNAITLSNNEDIDSPNKD